MGLKLQPASRKEVSRIAIGSLACDVVLIAVFAVLGLIGLVRFRYTVVLGALVGTAVAVLNFTLMCLMVQSVTGLDDEKKIRAKVQLSYNSRMLLQGVWCVVAFAAPCFQVVASVLPLLFPRVVIYYLQVTGQYKKSDRDTSAVTEDEPAEGDTEESEVIEIEHNESER